MAKKKKKKATLTGALGSLLEEKFNNNSAVTTDSNGNVTVNSNVSSKKEREGILVTGVKKAISGKSSIASKILGAATNGLGEVIYNTVEAGINENKERKKIKQTISTTEQKSNDTYNELMNYKKDNNINLLNQNSKRVKNDKKYQELLKNSQKSYKSFNEEREQKALDNTGTTAPEKIAYTIGGNFTTGMKGIESTTKKILGVETDSSETLLEKQAQKERKNSKGLEGVGLDVLGSVSRMLPQMMTGNSAGAIATGFANYGGGAYNEAKRDGASEKQATLYGIASGTLEMSMEKALGGLESVYGKSALGNSTNKITSKVLDKFIKNKAVRKTLTSMKGEFTEEYLQEFLGPIVEEALLDKDNGVGIKNTKNVKEVAKNLASYTAKNFFSTQNLYAGTLGAVTSGVMEGPQNFARNQWANQTGRDFDTGYTQNEQKVIDELVNNEINKKSKEQAINTEIDNAIKEQEKNFSISETNKNKIAERIRKEYETKDVNISNVKLSENEIKSIKKSVEQQLMEGNIDTDYITNVLGEDTDITNDDLLHRSFYEKSQKSVNYQYENNINESDNIKALKESASKVMNNTTKSRNFVDNVAKISEDRGTRYEFVNNEQLEKMGYEKNVNGLVGKDSNGNEKVLINIDSKQALNKIVGHETTHLLEGTEEYQSLQNVVKEYAQSKNDYEHRIKSIEKLYEGLDANIENEVTSDLVGEYIFNDEEFVKKLSVNQPNVFTKIYDYIKHIYKTITAGSQEARDLEKVKYRFEQAYKENVKDIKLDTNFSLSENALQEVSDVVNQTREDSEKSSTQFVKLKDNTIKSLVDYGVKDLPMLERSGHIRENILTEEQAKKLGFSTKNKHFHGLGVKTYLEIINSMDNPIGVYQYTNNGKYDNNNFIVVTPVEINGTNYIVPVEINQRGQYNQVEIDYNKIKTAYSKNNTDYVQNLLNQGKIKEIFNGSNSRKTSLNKSNIPQSNKNVKSDISNNSISNNNKNDTKYSLSDKVKNEEELKEKQYKIIESVNPAEDEYHTWIRNSEDIKTFEETLNDPDWIDYREEGFDPDYTGDMINDALKTGEIMVYSSYPIEMGTFVSPSKMEAETYSGNGKIYSKKVNLTDIAWIDPTQGQYAKINNLNSTKNSDIRYSLSEKNVPIADKYKSDENSNYKNEYSPLETNRKKTIDEKVERALQKGSYKAIQSATKTAQNYLDFDYQQKKSFKEQLSKFSGMTKEELTNVNTYRDIRNIVNQYANKEYKYVDDQVENIKKQIRNSKIMINDNLKNQITDYSDFRKQSKLKLGRDGQTIDSLYQELSNTYPYYFSNDITTEADMLYELSDFMNQDSSITEKYRIPDEDLKFYSDKIFNKLINNSISQEDINELQQQLEKKVERRTRKIVRQELLKKMDLKIEDFEIGNDIGNIAYQRTDPVRVNEKVFGYQMGTKINDATINFTKHQEAERTRWLNKERDDIKNLGIKARSKESSAVQKYGEGFYINDNGEKIEYTDSDLEKEFSNPKTREKIKHASKVIRSKYDSYIEQINSTLTELGYDEIPKRKDYFRHFEELTDKLSQWGVPFNKNDMMAEDLPTDINGLTEMNRPGKNYFASANQRTGLKTIYDAITGIDGYLEGASNLIFHTESIQRYRAVTRLVRESYGREHGLDDIDLLTDEELQQRIDDIRGNKLSRYVAWLDEQANALAGKKGAIDRGVERVLGRKVYTALNTLKSQVGSNMVGFNIRTPLTNFASVVQGASKTEKVAFLKGTVSTINNIFHKDDLIDKSDFLTSRFGSDILSKKVWQKVSNVGQILMTASDYFTANQVWRSKYYENLSKGMTEDASIKNADDFSARIMGDRTKGATAEMFNSKTLGFLTQFQLETNNQWSSMIHDNKIAKENGEKTTAGILFSLGQLFVGSHLFNIFMEGIGAGDVMPDPIEMLMKLFDPDDDKPIGDRIAEIRDEIIGQIPMGNMLSENGRFPISEALPVKQLLYGKDSNGNEKSRVETLLETLPYYLLPGGYSQIKKTTKGLSMYDDKLPVAGSYTKSGNLRFTADESLPGKIKTGLFGQYSSKSAQDYIDSGFKSINKSKIDEMIDLDMNSTEYRNYRDGLSKVGTKSKDKIEYINKLDVSTKQKNIMASNVLKKNVDMSNYDNYGSYDEFNYAMKNPVEYKQITMITNYSNYKKIKKELSEIKSDVDKNGNIISDSRKKKVISYINSLNLSIPQKAMLIKQEYSSFTKYDKQIFEYINGKDLTFIEKARTMKKLGFTKFDNQIIAYVRKHYPKVSMQIDVLKDLGFKVYKYNGKTYVKR